MHKIFDDNPFLWKEKVLSASKHTNKRQSDRNCKFGCLVGKIFDLLSLQRNARLEKGPRVGLGILVFDYVRGYSQKEQIKRHPHILVFFAGIQETSFKGFTSAFSIRQI